MKRILLSIFIAAVLLSHQASAGLTDKDIGEAYGVPTFRELSQTLVLLGGLDVNKPEVIQEFGKLAYCQIYLEKFKSDFDWNNVKRQITSRILEKKEMYRLRYEIYGTVKLDRYNFEGQFFPLDKKSRMVNVGSMIILSYEDFIPYCEKAKPKDIFPKVVYLQLSQPLMLDAINMPMDDAEKFLHKLEELKVKDRTLYVRFRFKILEVTKVTKSIIVGQGDGNVRADFLGKITQIDFFYDRDMTKWIASVPVSALK